MRRYGIPNNLGKCQNPGACSLGAGINFSVGEHIKIGESTGDIIDGPFHVECLTENFREQGIMYTENPYAALSGLDEPEQHETMVVRHGYLVKIGGRQKMVPTFQIETAP